MRTNTGASFYYTTDGLGSTILLTDSAQAAAATYSYDSWGNTTSAGAQAATSPWTYAGGYKDTATGYTKFGARYYNPFRGRFTQPDPSGQELNRYLYAGANPINSSDPMGYQYGDSGNSYACAPYNTPYCVGINGSYPSGPLTSCGYGFLFASFMMMLPGLKWVGLVGFVGPELAANA